MQNQLTTIKIHDIQINYHVLVCVFNVSIQVDLQTKIKQNNKRLGSRDNLRVPLNTL